MKNKGRDLGDASIGHEMPMIVRKPPEAKQETASALKRNRSVDALILDFHLLEL